MTGHLGPIRSSGAMDRPPFGLGDFGPEDLGRISWNRILEEIHIFSGFQQEQLVAA